MCLPTSYSWLCFSLHVDSLFALQRFFEETAEGEADPATWAEDFDLVGVSAYDH